MGRLSRKLIHCRLIGLDTSIFIYHFEEHPVYSPLTQELLSRVEAGKLEAKTSTITIMELIVKPLQRDRPDVANKYEALLVNFPHLQLIDLDRNAIRRSAQLRASYHLRPADALQVGACLAQGVDAFITNDRRLESLQSLVDIIVLQNFLSPVKD